MMKLIVLLIFCLSLLAQIHTPQRINNDDLRQEKIILELKANKEKVDYRVVENTNGHIFVFSDLDKDKNAKLSRSDFAKYEQAFTSKFLNLKYMMDDAPKGCTALFDINLRGDDLVICSEEKEKMKIVRDLLEGLIALE